jgi:ribonuclease R
MLSESPVRGRISVHPRGFGFVTVDTDQGEVVAFVTPPDLNPFLDGDVVSATVTASGPGRFTATSLTLVERWRTELFGSVTSHGKRLFLRVDRVVSNTDWAFEEAASEGLTEGTFVVASLRDGKVAPLRVVAAGADLGLERCVVRHGIRSVFPATVLDAARAPLAARGKGEQRRDLRDVPTVTIDAPITTDIDDALSALPATPDGALRVLVSIADVDAFVPAGSALDLEAQRRGTSVYLSGRVIPMLPESISSDAASLREGQERPALTVEMRIDAEGGVQAVDVYASLIRSHARLSYDAVNELLVTGASEEVPAAVMPTLRWLRTAAARLSAVRAARGGIEIDRDEAYVHLDAETREPTSVEPRGDTSAHQLVERLMVAANEALARWLVDRGLPGVFRVHDVPSGDRVEALACFAHNFGLEAGFGPALTPRGLAAFEAQFRGTALAPAIRTVLAKALGPARYTVHPGLHFGLAAPLYLHFTSPIRRYADLAVHRVVKRYLNGERAFLADDPTFEALARELNRAAYRAVKAEAERHHMLVARLFAGRVGERAAGNIVSIKPFGLVVQLKGTGVTGTVAMDALPDGPYRIEPGAHVASSDSRRYSVGDAIDVTISGTNEELGRVELTPVGAALPA